MLTVWFTTTFAASVLCAASLFGQSTAMPTVEVNSPSLNANKYINLTLDDFLEHDLAVNDQGTPREMSGIPLYKLLERAGWGQVENISQYLVKIDGDDTAVLPLSEVLRRSLDHRVWLIMQQDENPRSRFEAPLVVAVGSDGAVTASVNHVRHVRIANVTTQQLIDDAEFGHLSAYAGDEGGRTLWKVFGRIQGISLMIYTCSIEGRPEKSAVLLSEQVSEWNDGRLLEFLAGPVGLKVEPEAAIKRRGEFTAVRLRFAL